MKKWIALGCVLMLLLPVCLAEGTNASEQAAQLGEFLIARDYDSLCSHFSETLQASLSQEALVSSLQTIEKAYGALTALEVLGQQENGEYTSVRMRGTHENGELEYNFSLDKSGLLCGLHISPVAAPTAVPVQQSGEPVQLCAGEPAQTEGCLLVPDGEGPYPAVIFLLGSGPNDMDETIGGCAPIRDLAEGLLQQGIASIRCDKYTRAHPELWTEASTVSDEYTRYAASALKVLQADPRIGAVYLVGHSQGGLELPRVMNEIGADNFAGGVILAGTTEPLWKLQQRQNMDVLQTLSGDELTRAQAQIDAEVEKLEALTERWQAGDTAALAGETFFGAPALYQLDEMAHDAAALARQNDKPLFILHGGQDFQVTREEGVVCWQQALADTGLITVKEYPALNHLFIVQSTPSTGTVADYESGTVAQAVIADIASYIIPSPQP